jgi:hypothetical protein
MKRDTSEIYRSDMILIEAVSRKCNEALGYLETTLTHFPNIKKRTDLEPEQKTELISRLSWLNNRLSRIQDRVMEISSLSTEIHTKALNSKTVLENS